MGDGYGVGGGIYVSGNAIIRGNTISYNYGPGACGIFCWARSAIIRSCIVAGNAWSGIYCFGDSTYPMIDSCTITNNAGDGIRCVDCTLPTVRYCNIYDNDGYGIFNEQPNFVTDAEYNWWGDSTGPYHPTLNPGGLGDTVGDWVDFIPWLCWPGIEDRPVTNPVFNQSIVGATVLAGPLILPAGKTCRVFDITGRIVTPQAIKPGVYFIQMDDRIVEKVIKIR